MADERATIGSDPRRPPRARPRMGLAPVVILLAAACSDDGVRGQSASIADTGIGLTTGPASADSASADDTSARLDLAPSDDVPTPGLGCEDTTDAAALVFAPCSAAIVLAPPFDEDYECFELTNVPGVPPRYGGSTFSLVDPDTLLIGGDANTEPGALYSLEVTRDEQCHITGFASASAQQVAAAEYNDGGLVYAPNGTLFLARWPVNELGQLAPGAVATSRIDAMGPLGVSTGMQVDQGTAAIAFVPAEFPNEGAFKLLTWEGGFFYTVVIQPDGGQTYDVLSATYELTLAGGPEGFVYVSAENAQIEVPSVLVSEFSAGNVALYEIDDQADPIPATRRDFIVGLVGAEGAHIDPTGGDFVFTTFGGGNVIVVVQGFVPNLPPPAG
jgi:hypothetical protein